MVGVNPGWLSVSVARLGFFVIATPLIAPELALVSIRLPVLLFCATLPPLTVNNCPLGAPALLFARMLFKRVRLAVAPSPTIARSTMPVPLGSELSLTVMWVRLVVPFREKMALP